MTWTLVNQGLPGYPVDASGSVIKGISPGGIYLVGHETASSQYTNMGVLWTDTGADTLLMSPSGNGYNETFPNDVNDEGQSVGTFFGSQNPTSGGVLWSSTGATTVLNDPGGQGQSVPLAVNNLGGSVGYSVLSNNNHEPVYWSPAGASTVLAILGSGSLFDEAVDFNHDGYAVGVTNNQAVMWNVSTGEIVWSKNASSAAAAINGTSYSCGTYSNGAGAYWSPTGAETALSGPNGCQFFGMNASGLICGNSGGSAMIWNGPAGGAGTVLSHPGTGNAVALDINSNGAGCGYYIDSTSGLSVAAYWSAKGVVLTNLATILGSSWSNTQAVGIGNNAYIVENGTVNGAQQSFLLAYS